LSDHAFIPVSDGYTEFGYIAAVPGLHPAVEFRYRPVLFEQFDAHRAAYVSPVNFKSRHMVPPAVLKEYVKTWDITDPVTGETVPLTNANVARLNAAVMERMFWIVLGAQPRDLRDGEQWGKEEQEIKDEADLVGRYEAELRQERDAKNSSAVSSPV
jgi:hypothetical protein